jgi:hypothetical protein
MEDIRPVHGSGLSNAVHLTVDSEQLSMLNMFSNHYFCQDCAGGEAIATPLSASRLFVKNMVRMTALSVAVLSR